MSTTMDISGKRSSLLDPCLHSNTIRGRVTSTIVALSLNRNIIVLKELYDGISNLCTSDSVKTDEGQELLPNAIVLINEPGTDGEMLNVVGCHFISKNDIPLAAFSTSTILRSTMYFSITSMSSFWV